GRIGTTHLDIETQETDMLRRLKLHGLVEAAIFTRATRARWREEGGKPVFDMITHCVRYPLCQTPFRHPLSGEALASVHRLGALGGPLFLDQKVYHPQHLV